MNFLIIKFLFKIRRLINKILSKDEWLYEIEIAMDEQSKKEKQVLKKWN